MTLRLDNKKIFMVEIHEIIQRYSKIGESLKNPSNTGVWDAFRLNEDEVEALKNCNFSKDSLNAIEKIVKDTLLGAFHDSFALIDAVADPEVSDVKDVWLGLRLKEPTEDEVEDDFLHDQIYETYWEWLDIKSR